MSTTIHPPVGHNSGNLFHQLGPLEYVPVRSLKPSADNPRKHPKSLIVKLAAGMSAYGFLVPMLVNGNNVLITGEARWKAAIEAGLDLVPILRADHLTDAQVQAFRIFDNKTGSLAEWDEDKLAEQFRAIIEADAFAVDLTGFETGEIDACLEASTQALAGGVDAADEVEEPEPGAPITLPGDLWSMGQHRLLCGSSREEGAWARLMQGRVAALVFTDAPYNVPVNGHVSGTGRFAEFREASGEMTVAEFTDFLHQSYAAAAAHLKDGGIADLFMDFRHLPELHDAVARCGLTVLNLCVWDKGSGAMGSLYRAQHELVLVTKKGKAPHTNNVQLGKYGRYRTNVWSYPGANSFGKTRDADLADHPTVKPIALVADAIRDVTHPGEIVIDGFMGSGTTLLAAERARRIGYGIEIEGRYVDVAIRRWEKMTGREAILEATGETFAEVRERRQTDLADDVDDETSDDQMDQPLAAPNIRRRPRPLAA